MKRGGKVLWVVMALTAAVGAGMVLRQGLLSLDEPLNVSAPLRFKVSMGSRFSRVAADLSKQGVVAWPRAWCSTRG